MFRFALTLVAIVSLVASPAAAQQPDPSQQLRAFGQRMVGGTWHRKQPAGGSRQHTYKWALGHQYLLVSMSHQDEPNALAIVGVDPVTNKQTWWRFQDNGKVHVTVEDVTALAPNKDKVELNGADAVAIGSFGVEWPNKDTLKITPDPGARARGKDAKPERWERSEDVADLEWLEAKPPAKISPQMSLANYFTGNKRFDGVMPEGEKFVGAGHGKWILKGKFHIYTGTAVLDDQTMWSHIIIMGTDPETNLAASWEFSSLGDRSTVTFDKQGMALFGKHIQSNGDRQSFEGTFSVDGNVLTYRAKIGADGEDRLPYTWNWRDVKK